MKQLSLLLVFGLLIFPLSIFADIQLNAGELQLEVGGILLDIEQTSTIDDIAFDSSSFTVSMSSSQLFKISSAEGRSLSPSPFTRTSITCPSGTTVLTITMLAGDSVTDFVITPGEPGTCSTSDGGGGGGDGGDAGGEPPPSEPPPEEPPPSEPPPEEPPPSEPPPEEPPPSEPPPEEPPPSEPPPSEPPPSEPPPAGIGAAAGEGVTAIGSGVIQAVSSIGSGITEIFQGLTSGSAGSAFISRGAPNIGSYEWDTNQPLFTETGSVSSFKPIDGNNYKITIIHSVDASIQDASDGPFILTSSPLLSRNSFGGGGGFDFIRKADAQGSRYIKVLSPNGGERWTIGQTYFILWEYQNLPETNLVNIILNKGYNLTDSFKKIGGEVNKTVKELRANEDVARTVKEVAAPIAVTTTVVSAGALTITASAGSVNIAINLSEFFQALSFSRFYLLGLLRFRRKRPWGKVLDKLSGRPIRSAAVQIYDAEFNKLKDSQLTDADGRFSALITPGKYYILVSKSGYEPYQIGGINISSPDQVLALEIYLSPVKEEWSIEYLKKINVLNAFKRFMELINPYLLGFGTLVSLISAVIIPSALNYATLSVYILFDILKIYFSTHLIKPFGKVIDETTNEILPLSVVRIFEEEKNWLLATKVTDEEGRFNFLLASGKYYLTCSRAGYATFRSDTIVISKTGFPSLNIKLQRTQ